MKKLVFHVNVLIYESPAFNFTFHLSLAHFAQIDYWFSWRAGLACIFIKDLNFEILIKIIAFGN